MPAKATRPLSAKRTCPGDRSIVLGEMHPTRATQGRTELRDRPRLRSAECAKHSEFVDPTRDEAAAALAQRQSDRASDWGDLPSANSVACDTIPPEVRPSLGGDR